jgi:uncharacterized protein
LISSSPTIARRSLLLAAVLLPALLLPVQAHARTWPAPKGYVNDFAGIIDGASADSMDTLIRELVGKTQVEVAVVTIPNLEGETIDPAATELYKAWGIGTKRDEGALILLAREERRVKIEVGYGLEGIIPDGRAGSIIRNVMGPDLKADRFGPGLLRGVQAIAAIVAADRGVTLDRGGDVVVPPAHRGSNPMSLLFLFIVIFILMNVVASLRRRAYGDWRTGRRRGWYDPWGGFGGGIGGMGGFGGMGGGGGGGGGGGFGGFGGGGSGGGGASGGF